MHGLRHGFFLNECSQCPVSCFLPSYSGQIPDVELVYRDPVRMLCGFIRTFATMEEYCWRWAYTPEPKTSDGEEVTEHPASARWWKEQAKAVKALGGCLLALQLYSDDTTLNNKRSRSAYPMYCVPVNGSYDLYKLLFPVSVVAYMPVLKCPLKGASYRTTCTAPCAEMYIAAASIRTFNRMNVWHNRERDSVDRRRV